MKRSGSGCSFVSLHIVLEETLNKVLRVVLGIHVIVLLGKVVAERGGPPAGTPSRYWDPVSFGHLRLVVADLTVS